MKKNYVERVGLILPFAEERTRMQNRRLGALVTLGAALFVGPSIAQDTFHAVTASEKVCVPTGDSGTKWGNAVQATHLLREQGVRIHDIREVEYELDSAEPTEVCAEKPVGVLSEAISRVADVVLLGGDHDVSVNHHREIQLANNGN